MFLMDHSLLLIGLVVYAISGSNLVDALKSTAVYTCPHCKQANPE